MKNFKIVRWLVAGIVIVVVLVGSSYFTARLAYERANESTPADAPAQAHGHDSLPPSFDWVKPGDDPLLTLEQTVELYLHSIREGLKKHGGTGSIPPEDEARFRKDAAEAYKKAVEKLGRAPKLSEVTFKYSVTKTTTRSINPRGPMYEGPQTVEAIMKEFDHRYGRVVVVGSKVSMSEVDARYPRAEWVQRALDLGIRFKDYSDYSTILRARDTAFAAQMAPYPHPSQRSQLNKDLGGASDASLINLDAHIVAAARMSDQIWEGIEKGLLNDDIFFTPNRYIPTRSNQVHIRVILDLTSSSNLVLGGAVLYGPGDRDLTEEEVYVLTRHGVAPEGIELVYLDQNYEPLPPDFIPSFNWKGYVDNMTAEERGSALDWFANWDAAAYEEMSTLTWMRTADTIAALFMFGSELGGSFVPPKAQVLPPEPPLPPGKSAEETAAFFEYLERHMIERADLPEAVRQGLKRQYEAYRRWQDDRLRKQEEGR